METKKIDLTAKACAKEPGQTSFRSLVSMEWKPALGHTSRKYQMGSCNLDTVTRESARTWTRCMNAG
ncbi:hypothetical protein [Otoolea muris]|uniref:hypothetical protein n=1 Tax=Otoolea muris TaxID=2941515 RepID=UPI00203A8E86|nr:hypothetical protein [Otoolea muris]